MNDVSIEEMREDHLREVLEIEFDAFTAPWSLEMFRQEVEDKMISRAYVACVDGTVVGYIVAWFLHDEVHILNVAVPELRRQMGLGRGLLQHVLDQGRREKKVLATLEVRPSNEPARQLYQSLHFQPIGMRKNYYQDDREDAMVMVLEFGSDH